MTTSEVRSSSGSILHQPKAVWAVAFSCVIAFMGIGLVDPILPAISEGLQATPAQTMLLFSSYLIITALAMFFTSWVSSRLGAKRTLLIGLALIVVFAALAGASGSVGEIIGFRAGWGLGNALYISTALATIVGAASGGIDQAIILYEAALGLGIAVGPLLGGVLGGISWRGPFFGTAVLMAIGLVALLVLLPKSQERRAPVSIGATFAAMRRPALMVLALAALFYNFGFFVLLAYTPYPLETAAKAAGMAGFGAHELGLIFFGWGVGLALTSVFAAPRLTAAFGRTTVLIAMLVLLTAELVIMALFTTSLVVLVVCVISAGLFLGVMNTVMTESVMQATDLPRAVASSTYSGVRFLGGAVAPVVAGAVSTRISAQAPYWFGAAALVVSLLVVIVAGLHRRRAQPRTRTVAPETFSEMDEARAITVGDA